MKLFVIVLCLLSERYFIHRVSHNRFYWFASYFQTIRQHLSQTGSLQAGFILVAIVFPIVLLTWLLLFIFGHLAYGLVGLLLNIAIFYYCLGPGNPFYPVREEGTVDGAEVAAGRYFAKVNGQLFAVVFWYIVAGVTGILVYRLISLCQEYEPTEKLAKQLTALFDWIPARLTVFLYLLVGNFQQGVHFFIQKFFSTPARNERLLTEVGLLAAGTKEGEAVQLPYAENLVEHAMIVFLVFLAFFALVAWL